MTLVLGVRTESGIWLLADTRISHPDITQVEEIPGRLKLITLGSDICVGYAGAADRAIDIVNGLPPSPRGFTAVVEELERATDDGAIDFLAACSTDRHLLRISNGRRLLVEEEIWIGDTDAGKEYENLEVRSASSFAIEAKFGPHLARVARASDAFSKVVIEHRTPTVGGIVVRVGSRPEEFRYAEAAMAYLPPQRIRSGVATRLRFGGAPEGGFSYSLMAPDAPGFALLGLYVLQGSIGFVYAPMHNENPAKVSNVSQKGFREYVRSHYGVSIDGPGFA